MKKLSKVVMLPTEKASKIVLLPENNKLGYTEDITISKSLGHKPQHLYFLSDEKLPYDDKIFNDGVFYHIDPSGERYIITKDFSFRPNPNFCRRIIASTDESLGLPRPSNEFLKKYCELGGIEEVLVQYEDYLINPLTEQEVSITDTIAAEDLDIGHKLKVAPDNTITIYPIKK